MQTLNESLRQQWQTDGYLHLPQALSPEQVSFFSAEIDRVRAVPGYERDSDPNLPIGHYAWLDEILA